MLALRMRLSPLPSFPAAAHHRTVPGVPVSGQQGLARPSLWEPEGLPGPPSRRPLGPAGLLSVCESLLHS